MHHTQLNPIQIARFIISFSWIYHGLFPKLIHIAPLEKLMTASLGFSDELSIWITRSAGVGEIIFGIILFIFYQSKLIVALNIFALIMLLMFVCVFQPMVLIEAFNPVTTNLPIIAFSLILLNNIKNKQND
ncbi:DoxX-like family protein [Marinicellulosiphila megalodicopiae]|uniref:DoxX-like family protein n=1 Tax=Marinicellulosiphila megalodicopiae TaxID=2724896 RepID=UPI003BB1D333